MLKTIARVIYQTYHILFPSYIPVCRYSPTCSLYALQAIEKHGVFGVYLAAKRVLSCHPFSKRPLVDPI